MLLELLLLCLLASSDWPQFRGPGSDGHAAGPASPMEWSDTQNIAWKVQIPGLGWSTPVIVDNTVYVTTAVTAGEGLSLRALALDTATGAVLWDREVRSVETAPPIHKKNSHASPTPIVHDGAIFVHFGTLGTARLNAADGGIRWLCTELVYSPVHGSGGSPVLCDGRLVVVCDGSSKPFVAAIDSETGVVVWKTERSVQPRISHSFVTPAVAVVEGQPQVLAPGPGLFAAYDPGDGRELWKIVAPGWSVVPQPAIGNGLVIYNHDYDHPELIAARLGGQGDVTDTHIEWRIKRGAPSTPSPLLVGNELYFVSDDGIVTCADARSGETHYVERLGGNYSASPVFANGQVLLLNETGTATWIEPGQTFSVTGTNEVTGQTFATPAFSNGAMYLRTDESLYRIAHPSGQ